MATLLFANNIQTTLATNITSSQTSVTLASTAGLPSPSAGQYFVMTFTSGTTNEIVWVTNVTGSTITCIRAKESTSGTSFASGSYASCFPTAGTQQDFIQIDQLQNGAYTFTNGAGTANALTATIASNLNATSLPNGFQFILNSANANTSSATLNLTLNPTLPGSGSTTSTGALPIYKNGNSPLSGGEITGSNYLCLMTYNANYNGGAGAFVLENPFNAVTGVVGITQLQSEYFIYNTVGGSTDALTLTVPTGLTTLTDGAVVTFRNTVASNTTTTPTLNVTYGAIATGATTIKKYANQALSAGDTGGVGYICQLVYSSSASAWMLLNPAPSTSSGVTGLTAGSGISVSSPSGNVTVGNTGVLTVNGSAGTVTVTPASISAMALAGGNTVAGGNTFNGNNTFTGVNSVTSGGYFTCAVSTLGSSAFVATSGGATGFISPTSVQLYESGTGLEGYTGNSISIATRAYGANATFNYSGYNQQGNNLASWFVTSDALIKTNISPITGSLEKINALKPSSFSYIDDTATTNTGFIAQEFATVFPELTADSPVPEKYKDLVPEGIETIKGIIHDLNPYLVQAIQELNELVQTQAEEIAALKQKVGL